MATSRRPTQARGAVIERSLVQRWASRQHVQVATQGSGPRVRGYLDALLDLEQWLREQPKRTRRPGGIGR
jgi:hypothetical protein